MKDIPLADRPVIAKRNQADIFVSIHNNALPDGVNPFGEFGTASFYYNLQSIDLARAIHREMVAETGLPDYGVYHGNLAVIRPTEYPAVLVECAFMMLPEQEVLIKSDKFRKQVAKGGHCGHRIVLQGVRSWEIRRRSPRDPSSLTGSFISGCFWRVY
ncbi:MAG: N-acetylmuramoyl-L-alanine amidase [bacterium]|nr:N-acetylmuramoyl-L-alanine amidase [bacterium]